jgi:taurine dioxygenase
MIPAPSCTPLGNSFGTASGGRNDAHDHEAVHPVVRVHFETGRCSLHVNVAHTVRFEGMTEEESAPLLQFLFQHQVRPEHTCRFRWEVGSLAFWDNRCALHNPVNDHHGFRRRMHRVTLAGDCPVGPGQGSTGAGVS